MFECDMWNFPEIFSGPRFRGNWLERQEFYNKTLSRHSMPQDHGRPGLEKVRSPEDLYRVYGEGRQAVYCGEKSPFYCTRLEQLARRYPGCSFILLWRDPVEVCRSVKQAGMRSRFFRRRGFVSRLIFHQEEMIRQARRLQDRGVRIHHVSYGELTGNPQAACRAICDFLGLEFDPKMAGLDGADFSSVYRDPVHDHLRRGVIQRRSPARETLTHKVLAKLARFQVRWNRLTAGWYARPDDTARSFHEAGVIERCYHRIAGRFLHMLDDGRRVLFEFLPLNWLRAYRTTKAFLAAGWVEPGEKQGGMWRQFRQRPATVLVSAAILAAIGALDFYTGPWFSLLPIYLIPIATLTLGLSTGWGFVGAVTSAIIISLRPVYAAVGLPAGVVVWNCVMRILFFAPFVLLLGRRRGANLLADSPGAELTENG